MIKTLAIECPHCKKTFEVFLSNNALMVILNCPLCTTPLIYYKTRCFVLSRHQIDRIRKNRQDATVLKILHNIADEKQDGRYLRHASGRLETGPAQENFVAPPPTLLPCNNYITKDDIINLRIALETCADSKQFIDKM